MHRSRLAESFAEAVARMVTHQETMIAEAEAAHQADDEAPEPWPDQGTQQGPFPLPTSQE